MNTLVHGHIGHSEAVSNNLLVRFVIPRQYYSANSLRTSLMSSSSAPSV